MTVAVAFAQDAAKDSVCRAGETLVVRKVTPDVRRRYPYGVTFLRPEHLDSVIDYADTDLVPIVFKRGKTDLVLPNPSLDSIVGVINRIFDDKDVDLSYVWIGGSASPEGSEAHNMWLGEQRAMRLYDYIRSHTSIPDSLIRVDNLMEDWRTPLRLIRLHDFPNKERVLRIWAEQPDNSRRKHQIMAIDNGITWRYLINEMFRPARNARMVIVCVAEDLVVTYRRYNAPAHIPVYAPPAGGVSITALSAVPEYRGQFVAFKTNLAALGLLVANVGVEFSFGRGFSLDLPFYYSPYDIASKFRVRILGTQPELRYWLRRDMPGAGHFLGLNGTVAGFNVSFPGSNRFQDPEHALWGAGVSYGYALGFGKSKRWGLEFNIGAGYMNYHQDTFDNVDNGKLLYTKKKHFWGITRAGLSLTYKFWQRKRVASEKYVREAGL